MGAPYQRERPRGSGSVKYRSKGRLKFWAYAPQVDGEAEVIGKFETRWAAERALAAYLEGKRVA